LPAVAALVVVKFTTMGEAVPEDTCTAAPVAPTFPVGVAAKEAEPALMFNLEEVMVPAVWLMSPVLFKLTVSAVTPPLSEMSPKPAVAPTPVALGFVV